MDQSIQHLFDVPVVFRLISGVDEDVVQVYHAGTVNQASKGLVDIGLERCWGVRQTERHYVVLVMPVSGFESCLLFIPLPDLEPIIGVAKIQLSVDGSF